MQAKLIDAADLCYYYDHQLNVDLLVEKEASVGLVEEMIPKKLVQGSESALFDDKKVEPWDW